jgi:uncharacterized protein (TIGR02996 family)
VTTEYDFHCAIEANPDDGHTLVFSDWLRDRGDKRADGYAVTGTIHNTIHATGAKLLIGGRDGQLSSLPRVVRSTSWHGRAPSAIGQIRRITNTFPVLASRSLLESVYCPVLD